jgi:hypothetical protein
MKKLPSRTAQTLLVQEFVFNHTDWVVDSVDGTKKTFGSTVALSADPGEAALTGPAANTVVLDAVPMPGGAVIHSGEIIVETAYTGPTAATLSLGIAGTTTGLASAVNLLVAAKTALTATGVAALLANGGANLRATMAYTVANATAGKVRIRVAYTIDRRASENQIT